MPVQADAAASALEELHSEVGFQAGDGAAHRGLGDAQFGGGPADVLVACDDLEAAQGGQIHRGGPPS